MSLRDDLQIFRLGYKDEPGVGTAIAAFFGTCLLIVIVSIIAVGVLTWPYGFPAMAAGLWIGHKLNRWFRSA